MKNLAITYSGSGCETALSGNWFESHADYLFNFAVSRMHDPDVAKDLVQETCLAALKLRNGFSGRSSERTWLVGILRHKICDHLRKAYRERAVRVDPLLSNSEESSEESALWLQNVAAETQLPSNCMDLGEFCASLELALGALPPRIAQVFRLHEVEERSTREVCAEMKISPSNLGVMLYRCRKHLRGQLGDWLQPAN